MRVVLYAEGGREISGDLGLRHAPGDPLDLDNDWGPAHHLVARAIEEARRVPLRAVSFEEPLRTGRGTAARGTVLYDPQALRQLLCWAAPHKRPALAIVLVDEDGEANRKTTLEKAVEGLSVSRVIAVAVREFEAWLIADAEQVKDLFGPVQSPASLEDLRQREAKDLLMGWISKANKDEREVRLTLAQTCRLSVVRQRCPAFEEFLRELGRPPG